MINEGHRKPENIKKRNIKANERWLKKKPFKVKKDHPWKSQSKQEEILRERAKRNYFKRLREMG